MLSNQIQNNATEFVKTGSIILRDNNSGTINLVLHPEELGNVKISLEMNDKLVSARITVASEEAYQAFKESISSLNPGLMIPPSLTLIGGSSTIASSINL